MPEVIEGLDDSRKYPPMQQMIRTPFTDFFNIPHPICLAGMNQAVSWRKAPCVPCISRVNTDSTSSFVFRRPRHS